VAGAVTSAFEPLAAEATRLFAALREHVPDGSCRYCPVCLAIGVLRGEHPEVTEKAAAAGAALLAALRGAMEPAAAPAPADGTADRAADRVQKIDLD
jgi:hypothetical protein